jgi:hypothetical protein
MSQSSLDFKYEWKLVKEAMDFFTKTELSLTLLFPIYPSDSSLRGTTSSVDTDDDGWLVENLSIDWNSSLELDDIFM